MLPFANLSGDPEQDYFVDGVTESLNTDLSRISGSFVNGRHTAFTYRGKSVDLKQIGRELNVRYVLQGAVQRGGSRLRVNVQLTDAESSSYLWAERFDKPVADLLEMQDEIVARIARTLDVQLVVAESRRAARRLNPDAADLYFQGRYSFNKGLTLEYLAEARVFFEQALAIDPDHIDALSRAATVEASLGALLLTDRPHEHMTAAERRVLRALRLAPTMPGLISPWPSSLSARIGWPKAWLSASEPWHWIPIWLTLPRCWALRKIIWVALQIPRPTSMKPCGCPLAISSPSGG